MKKLEYLKNAIKQFHHYERNWMFTAFSLVFIDESTFKDHFDKPYYLFYKNGLYYTNADGEELIQIEDCVKDQPLFYFREPLQVDDTWLENISEPTETTVGRLLANAICIVSAFGRKVPYINKRFNVGEIESYLGKLIKSNPKPGEPVSDTDIYVKDYLVFTNSLKYLINFNTIAVHSATVKNVSKPKGIEVYKAQLIAEYADRLDQYEAIAEMEAKLKKFDSEWMQDDPSNDILVAGKVANIARKKMFLAFGARQTFSDDPKATFISNSLDEGWSKKPEHITAMLNEGRHGSYLRGAKTVDGGVTAKEIQRAVAGIHLVDTDCGVTFPYWVTVRKFNSKLWVNRYMQTPNGPVLLKTKDQVDAFIGQKINIKSPRYCRLDGSNICRICAGEGLFNTARDLSLAGYETASIFLLTSMKAIHGTVLSTQRLNIKDVLS